MTSATETMPPRGWFGGQTISMNNACSLVDGIQWGKLLLLNEFRAIKKVFVQNMNLFFVFFAFSTYNRLFVESTEVFQNSVHMQ